MKSKNILDQREELQIHNTSIAIIILTEEAFKQQLDSTIIAHYRSKCTGVLVQAIEQYISTSKTRTQRKEKIRP